VQFDADGDDMISANNKVTKVTKIRMQRTWKDAKSFVFIVTYHEHIIALRSGKIETQRTIVRPELYKALVNFHCKPSI
jgi:hypothetical protein